VEGPIRFPAFAGAPADADLQSLSVMLCDPRRPATVVPGRGNLRRWEFMLLPGEDDQAMTAPEVVDALVRPWIGDAPCHILRATTYRFHGLVAERWRAGRVFLAGDAAHQTPPFFGQGMCHGLRDAANLAWKLALVLRDQAGDALLDTYKAERDPQVRAVIAAAVQAGRYICELDPAKAARRDTELRAAMAAPTAMRSAADLISPYLDGVVGPGGGERFVHPQVQDAGGRRQMLDAATGGGFRLFTRGPAQDWRPSAQALHVLSALGARRWAVTAEPAPDSVVDVDGVLGEWLDARGADAVLLRPDAYVYGCARERALDALVIQLGAALHLNAAHTAPVEAALCPA
jgi:3-(3-hydroxy-phenyl)propionate hydroxylase